MPDLVLTGATPPALQAFANGVLARLQQVPAPTAGPLVLAVDGRSGAGKTDLAAVLAQRTGAAVLHMDDLYPGWDGLAAAVDLLRDLLTQLRTGRPVQQPVWDWRRVRTRARCRCRRPDCWSSRASARAAPPPSTCSSS